VNALELVAVNAGYDRTTVLRHVDLTVKAGSVTALLGPNGAGKSTLLKTVSGLLRASSGSVVFDGQDFGRMPANQRCRLGLCHIPEGRGVFPSLTVRENLYLQARPGQERDAMERCIQAFPILGARLGQKAGTLSGGQQQMLAMARAWAQDPKLILVDEASLGLAPIVVDEIFQFLRDVTAAGSSLLIVDQFIARALAMATEVYVLSHGSIVFAGSPAALGKGDVFDRYLGSGQGELN